MTGIAPYDVGKLLNRITEGPAQPRKARPNNRARKFARDKGPFAQSRRGIVLWMQRCSYTSRAIPLTYKTRNWPAGNETLKRRGSLTVWPDPAMG